MLAFDAVLVGCRMLDDLEFRMRSQHLIMHAADPVPAGSDLAIGHGKQMFAERFAERTEYVLRRVEGDAPH